MHRRVVALVAVAALSLGAAACTSGDDDDPTVPDVTTSSAAVEPATTTLANGPAATPEAAAKGLFDEWQAGDKEGASRYARQSAINTLFAHPSTDKVDYTDQGCQPEGGQFICSWTYPGGALQMTVEGVLGTDGYVVDTVTYRAD